MGLLHRHDWRFLTYLVYHGGPPILGHEERAHTDVQMICECGKIKTKRIADYVLSEAAMERYSKTVFAHELPRD